MPAAELKAGWHLLRARGSGQVTVLGIETTRAPPGQPFTTYNFEVASDHTYFVGQAGVWVHNKGKPCQRAFSIYDKFFEREAGNAWVAYERAMARYPATLGNETKLRVLNDVRRNFFNGTGTGAPPWRSIQKQNLGHGGNSHVLGQNLEAIGIARPGPGSVAAHHIVAHGDSRAEAARAILDNAGVDIDEAANGVFLPRFDGDALRMGDLGPAHQRIHTDGYYEALVDRLTGSSPNTLRDELQKIAAELIDGTFPW